MYEDIVVVGGDLTPCTSEDVDSTEEQLDFVFPKGYREYVTRFGEGILGGSYIRIYPPHRIREELTEWRQRIEEYWFWDDGHEVLTKKQALQCMIVGDTLDGDELIVHPDIPDRIYVLPRNSEDIHVAGDGLHEAIEWLCGSGTLTAAFDERVFEPFDSRKLT